VEETAEVLDISPQSVCAIGSWLERGSFGRWGSRFTNTDGSPPEANLYYYYFALSAARFSSAREPLSMFATE
jgi:hypothetical protein